MIVKVPELWKEEDLGKAIVTPTKSENISSTMGRLPAAASPAAEPMKAGVVLEGKDITIAAVESTVHMSMEAAEALKAEGINAEVIDLRTIKPLDYYLLLPISSGPSHHSCWMVLQPLIPEGARRVHRGKGYNHSSSGVNRAYAMDVAGLVAVFLGFSLR